MAPRVHVVVAYDRATRGIASDGVPGLQGIPWHLPEDLAFFRELTTRASPGRRNALVMGRVTREAIRRDLPGRATYVVSSTGPHPTLGAALAAAAADGAEAVFVAGGEALYAEALRSGAVHAIHATEVDAPPGIAYSRRFPELDQAAYVPWGATETRRSASGVPYRRVCLVRAADGRDVQLPPAAAPHPEAAYLDLVREALRHGAPREDRTGTGTLSLFGRHLRFSLRDGAFPVLTTKRVFFRGVVEELLWFVRGATNANELSARGVKIWDANAADHARRHPGVAPGDVGPVYGHQWRRFGAPYPGADGGVDQLAEVVRLAREDPSSRRNVLSAWNPAQLGEMALPPCHLLAQFWVHDGELSCQVYMRSCDLGLGLPFNVASYALLAHVVAACAGLRPGDLCFALGDAHVYRDHVDALRDQATRAPRPLPRLRPLPPRAGPDDYRAEDFVLEGYDPHPAVAMAMSV